MQSKDIRDSISNIIIMQDVKLFTFITLAETKNYTRTAEFLNLTQPAVTQHVKYLEDLYGKALIKKQGKKFELTEAGKLIYSYGLKILKLYRELDMNLNIGEEMKNTLGIGTTMTIGEHFLPPLLGEFKEQYKNIEIKLQIQDTEHNVTSLIKGDIDLALIEGSFDKTKFKYEKFMEDELVLIAHPSHIFASNRYASMEEILDGQLILREKGSGTRRAFEEKLKELQYDLSKLKPCMEIASPTVIISMVEANLGYSIISKKIAKNSIKKGTVVTVPVSGVKLTREFNFIYIDKFKDKIFKVFIDLCKSIESSRN